MAADHPPALDPRQSDPIPGLQRGLDSVVDGRVAPGDREVRSLREGRFPRSHRSRDRSRDPIVEELLIPNEMDRLHGRGDVMGLFSARCPWRSFAQYGERGFGIATG